MLNKFVGMYKLSKTLRFELKPIGATLENLKKSGSLDRDFVRAEKYQKMKDILDLQHKALLERTLSSIDVLACRLSEKNRTKKSPIIDDKGMLCWNNLALAYQSFRTSAKDKTAREELEYICAQYRSLIVEVIKTDKQFAILNASTPSDFIKNFLPECKDVSEKIAAEAFNGFACYFTGFQENRVNIYSEKAQKTSAANRAINENFPRFLKCCSVVEHILREYPNVFAEAEKHAAEKFSGLSLREWFKIEKYSDYLSQSGIEKFNFAVGLLNQQINWLKQSDEKARIDKGLGKIPTLYKQILSDRESASFVIEKLNADADVFAAIKKFSEYIDNNGLLKKIRNLLSSVNYNDGIFINADSLSEISNKLYGDWQVLRMALEAVAEEKFSHVTAEGKRRKLIEQWLSQSEYPLSYFSGAVRFDDKNKDWVKTDICKYWSSENLSEVFDAVDVSKVALQRVLGTEEKIGLRSRKDDVKAIKEYLDSLLAVLHIMKPLCVGAEIDRDTDFYGEYDALYDMIDDIVPLYNMVRNYITSKPSEEKKLKLMFDSPTLAAGWDKNKEDANNAVLLQKDNQYYLGVVNPKIPKKSRPDFSKLSTMDSANCYGKMVYKLLPGPNKMLPKVFFSNKGLPIYKPSEDLLKRYKNGDYKKGATFDLKFCHALIDFFKKSIAIHPGWSKFGFEFSPTSSYARIDEFYREISNQGYKISFENIPEKSIDSLVESGALYLFKLHNKDFAEGSTGRPNLHTIYWRKLFDAENLNNLILKLNGEAELFYRRASIKDPYIHKIGKKIVNRIGADKKAIPMQAYSQLVKLGDGEIVPADLTGEAKLLFESGNVLFKEVKHEIIKDKRFTEDKFFFHVPITINAKADDRVSKFNDLVNNAISASEKVNIIGIDRGERHLLYVSVIDSQGHVLKQCSFNTVGHVDYHSKLDQSEKARDTARKSWAEIGKIKDLKSGYLSVVVHEIAKLMVEYNAIVVLEDLNLGFKRGRSAIEKQVYQKFEKAMIDKLNYLVFKDNDPLSDGGALRGYQLADKFESFEKLSKQTGFVYYVPAAYTSKIDPTTGFTNIFDFKKCKNAEGIKKFFGLFDSIKYNEASNSFIFAFDYDKFITRFPSWKSSWEVYSAPRRLVYSREKKCDEEINPTMIIAEAIKKQGVKLEDGFDLGLYMRELEANRENASFFKEVFYGFERTLQMRNSSSKTGEDYIESPVKNSLGEFFDSRNATDQLPKNADANGAYHIALKGLLMLNELKTSKKPNLAIKNEDWIEFAQKRHC